MKNRSCSLAIIQEEKGRLGEKTAQKHSLTGKC